LASKALKEMDEMFKLATIEVSDMEKSLAFYQGIIGVPLLHRAKNPHGYELAFLGEDGKPQLELIAKGTPVVNSPESGFSIGFDVDDAQAVIRQSGGEHEGPINIGPNSRIYFIFDPDGYRVELLEIR
jgi:lactoylglutathione lyase